MKKTYDKWQRAGNARHYAKPFWRLYRMLCKSAKERGLKVELTYEQYRDKIATQPRCHHCGKKLKWVKHGESASSPNVDRKNNNKGYSLSNVVASCPRCNFARGRNFSYKEWNLMTKVLRDKVRR
jgi:ribosomal protein L34E